MLLLEPGNKILAETVEHQLTAIVTNEKKHGGEIHLCDFDDVTYRITVPLEGKVIKVSMGLPCYPQIQSLGAEDALKRIYEGLITDPEQNYNLTLQIDADKLNGATPESIANKISHFKDNIVGGVFDRAFTALAKSESIEPFKFNLRPDTSIFVNPTKERVTVVFDLAFTDKVDLAVARVFLQEFSESRRYIQAAPPVNFNDNPPLELKQFDITEPSKDPQHVGYLSFAILPAHIDTPAKKEKAVFALQSFRDYLMYHIKCSKAYFHSRMRARVTSLLQILNRAKMDPDEAQPKRTITGKTFERK